MDTLTFCRAMANVRSLPSAFAQYLITIAQKLPPKSRARIVDTCKRADAKIAVALHKCIDRLSHPAR